MSDRRDLPAEQAGVLVGAVAGVLSGWFLAAAVDILHELGHFLVAWWLGGAPKIEGTSLTTWDSMEAYHNDLVRVAGNGGQALMGFLAAVIGHTVFRYRTGPVRDEIANLVRWTGAGFLLRSAIIPHVHALRQPRADFARLNHPGLATVYALLCLGAIIATGIYFASRRPDR